MNVVKNPRIRDKHCVGTGNRLFLSFETSHGVSRCVYIGHIYIYIR